MGLRTTPLLSMALLACAPFGDAPVIEVQAQGGFSVPELTDGYLVHPDHDSDFDQVWVFLTNLPNACDTFHHVTDVLAAANGTTDRATLDMHAATLRDALPDEYWTLSAFVNVASQVEGEHPTVAGGGDVQFGRVEGAAVRLTLGFGDYRVAEGVDGLELRNSFDGSQWWALQPGGEVTISRYESDLGIRGTLAGEVHDSTVPRETQGQLDVAFEVLACPELEDWMSALGS